MFIYYLLFFINSKVEFFITFSKIRSLAGTLESKQCLGKKCQVVQMEYFVYDLIE